MSLLIETIRIESAEPQNLDLHEARMTRSAKQLFNKPFEFDLAPLFASAPTNGIYKCRVTYAQKVENVEFEKYAPKTVRSFKLVESDIDYFLKYQDRTILNNLLDQRGQADEIIIVRNGLITDTSYSNLIFYDGQNWLTPRTPLLKGIQRERLLLEGRVKEADISPADLPNYKSVMMINAMLPFDKARTLKCERIQMS